MLKRFNFTDFLDFCRNPVQQSHFQDLKISPFRKVFSTGFVKYYGSASKSLSFADVQCGNLIEAACPNIGLQA